MYIYIHVDIHVYTYIYTRVYCGPILETALYFGQLERKALV